MVTEKKMDELSYEEIVKELSATGELLRAHQNEKQSVLNDYDGERKRFHNGIIAKTALSSSVPMVRKMVRDLDKAIREDIRNIHKIAVKTQKFADRQAPKAFKVTLSGIKFGGKKSKRRRHRKR